MIYRVNDQEFQSFTAAVAYAKAIGGEVYEIETRKRRWWPAPKVSEKRMRQYREQKAAYEAQQRMADR